MTRFESWEDYFYPETYDSARGYGTLRNKLGIRDATELRRQEYALVFSRQAELHTAPNLLGRTYDVAHVRAIHRYLFQDVYEWAGEFRTVDMAKGTGVFAHWDTGIQDRLEDVHYIIQEIQWKHLDYESFSASSALVFAYLNAAHPFREGNGRSSKVFMQHVAEQSRFQFDFTQIDPRLWNHASALSVPVSPSFEPNPRPLIGVFQAATIDRPAT